MSNFIKEIPLDCLHVYAKYGLDEEEIAFIEKMIKAME